MVGKELSSAIIVKETPEMKLLMLLMYILASYSLPELLLVQKYGAA